MSVKVKHSLEKVDELIEQLISVTIEWLSLETHTPEQLVLNAERIKALRRLQKILRKELRSETGSGERVWQVVNIVIATVTRFVLDRMSDSIHYQLCREYGKLLLAHGSSSNRCKDHDWENYKIFKNGEGLDPIRSRRETWLNY